MTLWSIRGRRPPDVVTDLGVALLVGVVLAVAMRVARESNSVPPDALAYLIGVVLAALTLARRRRPLAVLLGSAVLLVLYYSLQYPGISPAIALGVPLYAAAVAGRARWSSGVAAFFLAAGLFVRGVREGEALLAVGVDMVEKTSLMVVVVLLGVAVRARRLHAEAAARALVAAEAQRERDAARRVAEERLRIARDLHDVLAHTIATVTVQAGVALDAVEDSPGQAREALGVIRTAGRSATEELRATVGALRGGEEPGGAASRGPAPSLDELDRLLVVTEGSGVRVDLARVGEVVPLPPEVELTAYRVVQESLTNIVRHSEAANASVTVRYDAGSLVVEVVDDGVGPGIENAAPSGHGIDGMRERVAVLRGSLVTGPGPAGGFVVRTTLPTGDVSGGIGRAPASPPVRSAEPLVP